MKDNDNRTSYNKLVGRIDEEYYFLDDTFEHSPDFKGATATVLQPVSRSEYEDMRDNPEDYLEEAWQMAVQGGTTTDSLKEWSRWAIDVDGDDILWDLSGSDLWDQLRDIGLSEEEYPIFQCTGGGRSFSKNMEFDEVYAPELVKIINKFEKVEA